MINVKLYKLQHWKCDRGSVSCLIGEWKQNMKGWTKKNYYPYNCRI